MFLCNCMTKEALDAEIDDPDWSLGAHASPQFLSASLEMSTEWVNACKAYLQDDIEADYRDDDYVMIELKWSTTGWQELDPTNGARSYQVWTAKDADNNDVMGIMVIQRVNLYEGGTL